MKFPKHISLSIEHNQHKGYYLSIKDYFDRYPHLEDVDPIEKQKCIDEDSIWEIEWYPDTPIGSYLEVASTLERALELMNKVDI